MGTEDGPRLNEMVAFLKDVDPAALAEQRSQLPAIANRLDLGVFAGGGPETAEAIDTAVLRQSAAFTVKALGIAASRCRRATDIALRKIISARRARLIGQFVAIVSGSGVIASIAGDQKIAGLICGLLTLTSSLATAYADYKGALLIDGTDAQKALRDLATITFELELLSSNIITLRDYGRDLSPMTAMINDANALIRRLSETAAGLIGSTPTPIVTDPKVFDDPVLSPISNSP